MPRVEIETLKASRIVGGKALHTRKVLASLVITIVSDMRYEDDVLSREACASRAGTGNNKITYVLVTKRSHCLVCTKEVMYVVYNVHRQNHRVIVDDHKKITV